MVGKMFKNARLLSKDRDRDLKIAPASNYKFARNINSMPLALNEVGEAQKHYPIFFLKDRDGVIPFAVLGLKEGENSFVNNQGEWRKRRYVPSLIRAYPFVLSKTKNEESQEDVLSIAIDESFEGLNSKDGQRVFDDEGNPNEFGKKIIDFLQKSYSSLESAKQVGKILDEMELLKKVDATVESNGEKFVLQGVLQVDSEKLNKLSDENLLRLAKTGSFNLIYSHLNSLSNFQNLL